MMMKARASAEGVKRFHPSQTEAGALVWQPAKSSAKGSSIHILDLFIDAVPFAQDFNGAGEQCLALDLAASLIGEAV